MQSALSDDSLLLQRIAARDEQALATFYDRKSAAAYGLAVRMLGDSQAAQDAVQEAFISLWRSSARYEPSRGSAHGYLMTIVRNRALDALRKQRRRPRPDGDEFAEADFAAIGDTGGEVEDRERGRLIRDALAELPQPQRQALGLAYFAGLSHRDISDRLQEPLGTVKGRIRLGLERMREIVGTDLTPHLDQA